MAFDGEGTIYIPLEEFWAFVGKYAPQSDGEIRFGVPTVNKGGGDIEIAYAMGTESAPPDSWAVKPRAVREWEELP